MKSLDIRDYLNVITSEHRVRPKYMDWVSSLLNLLIGDSDLLGNYELAFGLDTAVGKQLDIIGHIVGIDRTIDFVLTNGSNVLDDDNYRLCIKSKIARNRWDGTTTGLYEIWHQLFGDDLVLDFIDHQNMSCDISVGTDIMSEDIFRLIHNDMILPRPVGVRYSYDYGLKAIFAWDEDFSYLRGWDIGYWTEDLDYGDKSVFSWDSDLAQYRGWDIGFWTLTYSMPKGTYNEN